MNGRSVPVMMYHHISPSAGSITTSPENFESQLVWLKRHGYRSLTTTEFAAHLAGQLAPPRSVLITFDDGYLDNWVYAYPLLQRYGFSAVIFIVTDWIGQGECRARLGETSIPATPSHDACELAIAEGHADSVMLRWSEIRAMRESGVVEFHSHTHTHTRWDLRIGEPDKNARMREELAASRAVLEHELGEVSAHFCWPQGYFDEDYVRVAQESGFRYLYTTRAFGQNRPGGDPAHIYRFAVRNTHGSSVGRHLRVTADPLMGPVFHAFKRWRRSLRAK